MTLDDEDPRERPWHPRLAPRLIGHQAGVQRLETAVASGRPHHAWLITGAKGIGKATFAYGLARRLLAGSNATQSNGWINARSHPQLFVLERSLNDVKPRRLKAEISVEDARRMGAFFARTGGHDSWRIAIIDAVDDLNTESGNALLKLVEEPPARCLLFLLCHQPGRSLRTLRSRCLNLPLSPLTEEETVDVLTNLPLDPRPDNAAAMTAAKLAQGRPGHALELLDSVGAKAFEKFLGSPRLSPSDQLNIAGQFTSRQQALGDFSVFADLLLDWMAREARTNADGLRGQKLADAHAQFAARRRVVEGYNLDRRVAVMEALQMLT